MNVNYLILEEQANKLLKRGTSGVTMDALTANFSENQNLLALHRNLVRVDKFIAIDEQKVAEAEKFYREIAEALSKRLTYAESEIDIHTQGSARTRTLIRAPMRNLFDIDAICQITSSQAERQTPLEFFEQIGQTLEDAGFDIEEKKRCWRINKPQSGYYVDLTPAVPATFVSEAQRFTYLIQYQDSAVYVVDCPQQSWKSSNPKGFAKWIEQQNEFSKNLIQRITICADSISYSEGGTRASIEDVPDQNISHEEFLLLAIRLFKRHRDIKVRDNLIDSDSKPISIIISTLLGQCVEAIVKNRRTFTSLPNLLLDIALKLPHLIPSENGMPVIPNPTAPGENFADRWLEENGKRQKTFDRWVDLLQKDIKQLITTNDPRKKLDELFGTTQMTTTDNHLGHDESNNLGIGIVARKPTTNSANVPKDGLA